MTNPLITVEDVPLNKFHQTLTLRSGGGGFADGYVLCVIGVALAQISSALHLDAFWEGMIAASSLIGVFFGGFLGGWLTDRLGRRKVYFLGPLLFIVASLAHLWADSAVAMFLLRLLIGIGVGIEYPVATSMLVEFMPRKYRGSRLAMLTLLWFAGAACAYLVGEVMLRTLGSDAWPLVLASAAVVGLFLLVVRLGSPESARWLLSKGRDAEAEAVIKAVYGDDFGLGNLAQETTGPSLGFSSLLHSGYGKRMLFVLTFWTCAIVPIFAVYSFAPKVLAALNLTGDLASLGSALITFLFFAGCTIATRIINRIDRRSMLGYSFLLSAIALLGLGYFHDQSGALTLALFAAYALFTGGAQVLILVYPNEIFPTELRTFAVGFGTSISRIGAAVGTYFVPVSLSQMGIAQTLYVAAGICIVGLLVSMMLAPETRTLNLQQAASLG
ncbi:MFS transporter [Pseudomonas sp. S31]|uniref:MFS transporter n=1 Tax=Pseudomonas sp. S31 TaxID=1564473 RepID=UPI0019147E65|nr:MFS transporter [Pseudomonas sp. S31]MBK5001926.1 MFS transporter [Pseudomonas sp. S31]